MTRLIPKVVTKIRGIFTPQTFASINGYRYYAYNEKKRESIDVPLIFHSFVSIKKNDPFASLFALPIDDTITLPSAKQ